MARNTKLFLILFICGLISLFVIYKTVGPQILYVVKPPKYVPKGYTLTKHYEEQQTEGGKIFVSKLMKGDKEIQITQLSKFVWTCNGPTKTVASTEICYFQRPGSNPEYNLIFYNKYESTMQIYTNDKELSDEDLGKIITNF